RLSFVLYADGALPDLHSFPTRRSSDLQHHQELLAAVARDQVGAAQQALQGLGELAQDLVADQVAVAVVDLLEAVQVDEGDRQRLDRKSTRLNSSHVKISYAVFCLKKKK